MKACGDLASLPVPFTAAAKETLSQKQKPSPAWLQRGHYPGQRPPRVYTADHPRWGISAATSVSIYTWPCCCRTLSHSSWIFISPYVAGLPTWSEAPGRGAANMSTTGRITTSARRQRPLQRIINVGFVRGTREVTFKSISAAIEGSRPEPQSPCQEVLV